MLNIFGNIKISNEAFSTSTTVSFTMFEPGNLSFIVKDISGKIVYNIHEEIETAGDYEFEWLPVDINGNKLQQGVYTLHLLSQDSRATRLILVDD